MKKLFSLIVFSFVLINAKAQEAFTIENYRVEIKLNKDASLDISEIIDAHFTEDRHGIIRKIPFRYPIQELPAGTQKAEQQMVSGGSIRTIVENIEVPGRDFKLSTEGDFKEVKIGSENKYINGDQQFVINYRVLNAVNFFNDHSELYFNLIGNQWATQINSASFKIELPEALADTTQYFVATGAPGSRENNTISKWIDDKTFTGSITKPLNAYEGLTVGIKFPQNFLIKPDYRFRGIGWLLIPVAFFVIMFLTWKKWGKDDEVTVQTEYYPPDNISPSISGYIIDGKLDRRDLTALIPYWGAGGYLKVNETEKKEFFGIIKSNEYEFVKIKDLPETSYKFEKTLFNGIFKTGDNVKLSALKNVLYTTMNSAKSELETEVSRGDYYVKYSRAMGCLFPFFGLIFFAVGITTIVNDVWSNLWLSVGLIASGIIIIGFGLLMTKKTKKGTLLYQKLLGFKEFIKSVEKDRLQEFLKQDENYFDKVLPYAIVFDMADKWKDKLKGLEVPPPKWYSGQYAGANFNTMLFMSSLDNSMNAMSENFYSSPGSSGSSGGSFGGGGFSGGGFGGGGGSSW